MPADMHARHCGRESRRRVFPIPAKGSRKVLLAYNQALPSHGARARYVYPLSLSTERATRIVLGHPEGFHEAFANLYADAAEVIAARRTGGRPDPLALEFPTVEDGARGVKFVEAAVDSHRAGGRWTDARVALP